MDICGNISLHILLWLFCHLSCYISGERCKFPRSWKGRWYQNGLGAFEIKSRSIDGKGACEQIYKHYYIVKNREADDCLKCLLILERHKNILQYRESFCRPLDVAPSDICEAIKAENELHTVVRVKADSVMCPITEAYFFTYATGTVGMCDKTISQAKPCVGSEKYQLSFQHCNEQAALHDTRFSLECLAVWKDGSENFMYGYMSSDKIGESYYRCFKYEKYGTDVYMTMSLDASCRGLFSARSGLFEMRLTPDVYGWPQPQCVFPSWLEGLAWRDVEGKVIFQLGGDNQRLYVFSNDLGETHMINEHRCIDTVKEKEQTYILQTFATIKCKSSYKCVKIRFIEKLAMYIQIGDAKSDKNGPQCQSGTDYTENSLISAYTENVVSCPHPAIYPSRSSCSGSLNIGCHNTTNIIYKTNCHGMKGFTLQCKAFWEDGDTTYVIGHPIGISSLVGRFQCYSFQRKGNSLEWRSDPKCTHVTSKNHKYKDVINFSIKKGKCFGHKGKTEENEVIKWTHPPITPKQRHQQSAPHEHSDSSTYKPKNNWSNQRRHLPNTEDNTPEISYIIVESSSSSLFYKTNLYILNSICFLLISCHHIVITIL